MAAAFFLVLVLAWVVVCLPAFNRKVREQSPLMSTRLFKRGLELIGSEGHGRFVREFGRPPVNRSPFAPPESASTGAGASKGLAVRRIPTLLLCTLVAGVVATGVMALAKGGSMWEVHLATLGALAIFVSLLMEEKHRKLERKRKVRTLRAHPAYRARRLGAAEAEQAAGLQLVAGAE